MDDIFMHVDGVAFSSYEVALSVAIKLYITDPIHQVLSDEDLGFIISSLRGKVNGTPLPCQNIMRQIQWHSQEGVFSIYRSFWRKEAKRVYDALTSRHAKRIAALLEKRSF